jgi:hypothetical protein
MTVLIRFSGLKKRGICSSWPQLKRLIERHNFPPGRLLSPNVRVWDQEEEIVPWLASRPVANTQPLRGRPRLLHEQRLAREAAEAERLNSGAEAPAGPAKRHAGSDRLEGAGSAPADRRSRSALESAT